MSKALSKARFADKQMRVLRKATLKKPSKKLYTEAESKLRRSLMGKLNARKKKLANMSPIEYVIKDKRTMKSIQGKIGQGQLREDLYYAGYFDEPDYSESGRDFREWMIDEGDDSLLDQVLAVVNVKEPIDAQITRDPEYEMTVDTLEARQRATVEGEIEDIESQLSKINKKAQDRKNREMLAYLDKKYRLRNGSGLLKALSQGEIVYSALTNPERAAIDYLKNTIATTIVDSIDFSGVDEDQAFITKHALYTGLMGNPVGGLKAALRGNAVLEITKKYGNAAGELAGGMMDFTTSALEGKANTKPLASAMFSYIISQTPLDKSLMKEMAETAVNVDDTSTNQAENTKMFSRDLMMDIAKDVILSGFNLTAALPKIAKDVIKDSVQYVARDVKATDKDTKKAKEDEKEKKKAAESLKKFEGDKELSEEEILNILSKFDMDQ